MTTTAGVPAARGRPRDPNMEERVYAAALSVYSDRGWAGFTLDAVAKAAGAGNAAIYGRWGSKEELLAQAIQANALALEPIDTGTSRGDLLALARHFLLGYRVPAGVAGLRMTLDARSNRHLAELFEAERNGARRATALEAVRRAQQRGDLIASVSPGDVLYILAGATLSRELYSPADAAPGRERTTSADERFLARLVEGLLKEAEG
jgi:AcrR family transcriptional regulator